MKDYQQRVVAEKNELDAKIVKLRTFLIGDTFKSLPDGEPERMRRQLSLMERYSAVLGERIGAFR